MISSDWGVTRSCVEALNVYMSGSTLKPFGEAGWYSDGPEVMLVSEEPDGQWRLEKWSEDPRPAMRRILELPEQVNIE